jgi:undecaprenyl phosphate N,N'-diacetylbacillosamine 1-phosphate transferase
MYRNFVKRILDCFLSGIAIVILSPIILITAIIVRIKLGSPVIFKQERPGKDEKLFKLYKFRSMTDEKDADGNLLPDEERLPQFGRVLRTTSLDELPELVNIFKGDMAIVGPRPLLVRYLPYYKAEERVRHSVRPGLTGLAQVNGRNNLDWDDRIALDVEYVNNITLTEDFKIILKTVEKVLKRSDIASGEQLVSTILLMSPYASSFPSIKSFIPLRRLRVSPLWLSAAGRRARQLIHP